MTYKFFHHAEITPLFCLNEDWQPGSPDPGDSDYFYLLRDDLWWCHHGEVLKASSCYAAVAQGYKNFPVVQAIERKGKRPSFVLDGTCGWGRDTLAIALSGVQVKAIEKSFAPVVFLQYALAHVFPKVQQFVEIVHGAFEHSNILEPECLYLDPLFFEGKKTKSKKAIEMLYNDEIDPIGQYQELVTGIIRQNPNMLVIKQPLGAKGWLKKYVAQEKKFKACQFERYYLDGRILTYDDFFSYRELFIR